MKTILLKFRKYGLRGVIDTFLRLFQRDTPLHREMLRLAEKQITPVQYGITIIGDMTTHTSLTKVLCDLYQKLLSLGIPCQCLDTTKPIPESFEFLKYDNIICMLINPLPRKLRKRVRTSIIAFWEFDSGLFEAYPHLADGETLIAMSDFNFDYYARNLPAGQARKILYPLQLPQQPTISSHAIRQKFGIPQSVFTVFFNFDLGTSRKNPEGALAAFAKAFVNVDDAVLVFKTMSSKRFPECLQAINNQAKELGIDHKLITINDYLPDDEMLALTNACDAYMSLHRGEGFGLGVAEAMYLAKPVVVTDWSATSEFCNADNALLIPYERRPLQNIDYNYLPYDSVTYWAEPDVDAAAKALRQLYHDPALRERLGRNGKRFVVTHFSSENFRKSIQEFLEEDFTHPKHTTA